jgi:hypothetical protein
MIVVRSGFARLYRLRPIQLPALLVHNPKILNSYGGVGWKLSVVLPWTSCAIWLPYFFGASRLRV